MKYQKGELGEIENSNNVKGYLTFYPFSSLRKDTEGIWIRHKRGNGYKPLWEFLNTKNTGWVIQLDVYGSRLPHGPVYIYYTKDDKGKYTEPRILIVADANYHIQSVLGLGLHQSIESSMALIALEKIESFPGNKKRKKIAHDIALLARLGDKINNDIELTKKELRFLYEIDSKIESFYHIADPKKEELKAKRNIKKDLAYIFGCKEENIGTNITDFDTNKIIYYYGSLEWEKDFVPDTFKDLKRIIGGASFPNLTSAAGLNNLQQVDGAYFSSLTNAEGLNNLRNIRGGAIFSNLIYAKGLNNLRNISAQASFPKLTNAEGLNNLQYIGNYAIFTSLKSAKGLNSLKYIGEDANFSSLISAQGLDSLQNIVGEADFSSLPEATGLNNLKNIGEHAGFPNLINAKGLDSLQNIGGIAYFPKLITAQGLENLQHIGGYADFGSLINAESLHNLKYIGRRFNFRNLTSIKGLENINIDYMDSNR